MSKETTEKQPKERAPKKKGLAAINVHVQNLSLEEKLALRDDLNKHIEAHKKSLEQQLNLIK